MATRFMHTILAWQAGETAGLSEAERFEFLIGSLLPDAIERSKKKETHFNMFPGCLKRDNAAFKEHLKPASPWMRAGWIFHLNLDDIWQTTCLRSRLLLAPFFLIRYGLGIGRVYYQELSYFDVLFRRQLAPGVIESLRSSLTVLHNTIPEPWTGIFQEEWQNLIQKILDDLTKETSYQGPWMIGEECFWRFYRRAQDSIVTIH